MITRRWVRLGLLSLVFITALVGANDTVFRDRFEPGFLSGLRLAEAPTGAVNGQVLVTQPQLILLNQFSTQWLGGNQTVTASVASGSATLGGTLSVAAVNGVVTFTDLSLSGSGQVVLRFSLDGFDPVLAPALTLVDATVAVLSTTAVSSVTTTTSISGGSVSSDGGAEVIARGVVWSTSPNPTVDVNEGITSDGVGTGAFTSNLTGLVPATTYYARAFATNAQGTAYGTEVSFTTLGADTTQVVEVTSATGRIWMDRNLGASRAAISSTDTQSYGDLYQWGRRADGHQYRVSPTTGTLSGSDAPPNDRFIVNAFSGFDWRSPQNDALWQGLSGTNNPCPSGFRVPTLAEWTLEYATWSSQDAAGALGSVLRLPLAGVRTYNSGDVQFADTVGLYWSSSVGTFGLAYEIDFEVNVTGAQAPRAHGLSVRCLKDTGLTLPVLSTSAASSVTTTTASVGGNITSGGGAEVAERGVVWSTTQNPTVDVNMGKTTSGIGTGVFSVGLTGLTPATTYYARAYATNSVGTTYGSEVSFTTLGADTTTVVEVTSLTGRVWMDRNLGASQVATSVTDTAAYGDLYQWGRADDGHQLRSSATTTTLSVGNQPGHDEFVLSSNSPFDWRATANDTVWQGLSGTNNPCPSGFRVPTLAEWALEYATWSSQDAAGALGSVLRLPLAGGRTHDTGDVLAADAAGLYWSSSVATAGLVSYVAFEVSMAPGTGAQSPRATGLSVRCLKDTGLTLSTLLTTSASSVTTTTAQTGGNITSGGGAEVSARGVVWGLSSGPTLASHLGQISEGTGIGAFTSSLTGLVPNTTYYVRAYATNSEGTAYGGEISFTTVGADNTTVEEVTSPTGRVWMDRNLGASRVATASNDTAAYGSLYQWGRRPDGHQFTSSPTTTTLSNTDTPLHDEFILTSNSPFDWRVPPNDALWQGVNGINNPCPSGFRLPTNAEWQLEYATWDTPDFAGALASVLKLPMPGGRSGADGTFDYVDFWGFYWSSSVATPDLSSVINFSIGGNAVNLSTNGRRDNGFSVRCLKDTGLTTATLSTTAASSVTSTTATLGGNITSGGGAEITARGVVWGTSSGPTLASNTGQTSDGTGTGSFTSSLTGLDPVRTYFVRAYAVNVEGTSYGDEVSFTTDGTDTTAVVEVTSANGRIWMDRNLGASRAATSLTDADAFGELYQWGRADDGHQVRTSATTSTLSAGDQPGHGDFIVAPTSPNHWQVAFNGALWQGVSGVNNPCPSGFRIPTTQEWQTEYNSWGGTAASDAFNSPLKLPIGGIRNANDGSLVGAGSSGFYWTSTFSTIQDGALARFLSLSASFGADLSSFDLLAQGYSVRCIKD